MKAFFPSMPRNADQHHVLKVRAYSALIDTGLRAARADMAAQRLLLELTETRTATMYINGQQLNLEMLGVSATATNSPTAILRSWQAQARAFLEQHGGALHA